MELDGGSWNSVGIGSPAQSITFNVDYDDEGIISFEIYAVNSNGELVGVLLLQ